MAEQKYVVFRLGEEYYGVDIMKVKEVTEVIEMTPVSNAPDFVEGIINLRGDITPIINLKKRFSKPENISKREHRILIVNLDDKQVGFMVDDASQVIAMEDGQVQKTPILIGSENKRYIEGVGNVGGKMVLIVDLIKVLDEDERKELIEL